MDIYQSEDEQVEAIRRWWIENGKAVVIGIVIALAVVFGWRTWVKHNEAQAEGASIRYEQMLGVVGDHHPKQAIEAGRELVEKYPDSPYAVFASFEMAKIMIQRKQLDSAAAQLSWAAQHAAMPELKALARARLARVQLAMNKPAEALKTAADAKAGSMRPEFAEVRGDAYLAQGKRVKARAAYEEALAGYTGVPGKQQLLKMKIDDLADAKEGGK